eukprot:1160653-Pelagomonas_calceolata.AAC.3
MLGAEIKKCVMLVACMPGIDVWRFEVRGVWCLLPGLGSPVYERSSDGYKCFSCILALHLPALHATQVEHFSRYGLLPEVEAEVEDLGITGTPGPDIAGPGFGGGAISHIGRATSCSAGLYHT